MKLGSLEVINDHSSSRWPQTVPFQARQGHNKPGSGIGAGDLRSRDIRVDLCAYSAIGKLGCRSILRLERQDSTISVSTGGDPLQKISKAVAPRDTKQLFESVSPAKLLYGYGSCGFLLVALSEPDL